MQLFKEALDLLHRLGSVPANVIQDFKVLSEKAKAAAVEAMDAEAMLGDIPDEFLDPIQVFGTFLLDEFSRTSLFPRLSKWHCGC
jgi:hypothetical protein